MNDTKTEAAQATIDLEKPQPSNLALRTGGTVIAPWQAPVWDSARLALAKKMVCPPGTTDLEFEYCIAWCTRTGLDPFIQQAYFVPRREKLADGSYVNKVAPMAAIAGLAARADSMPDYGGMKSDTVYPGDEFYVDSDAGIVTHKWTLEARVKAGGKDWKLKPLGAWATATRVGRFVPVTYLTTDERNPNNGSPFWAPAKMGAQIRKCAEAEQYRKAYPNIFAGAYIREEMEHGEEREVNTPPAPAKTPTGKSDALRAKLGVKTVEMPKTVESAQAPNPDPPNANEGRLSVTRPDGKRVWMDEATLADLEHAQQIGAAAVKDKKLTAQQRAASQVKLEQVKAEIAKRSAPTEEVPPDCIPFGPLKGTLITDVSTLELQEVTTLANQYLASATPSAETKAIRDGLATIADEIAKREGAEPPAAPEPSSDG